MTSIKYYLLLGLIPFLQMLSGQPNNFVIPFSLTEHNNISVVAILNKLDTVNLMFHTAASSMTLTEEATKKMHSITFDGKAEGVKSWGGDSNSARLSEKNTLQIGGMTFENISISENKFSGPLTDGKFGIDLFKERVILINFDNKTLTISSDLPKDLKKYEKIKLTFEDEMLFLEAISKIGKNLLPNKFLIHSGYSGDLLFDDQFANDHKLEDQLKIIGEKELKDSYGNIIKTKKAILPTFKIGSTKLSNVPVGFFSGALGRQKMSILGGDILKRFNVVIDAKRAYIYLRINSLYKVEYTKN